MSRYELNILRLGVFIFVTCIIFMLHCRAPQQGFHSDWPENVTRYYIGPEYWANRVEDWRIHDGRLECINGRRPLRTVHLLTHRLAGRAGKMKMRVTAGLIGSDAAVDTASWCGFLIGAGPLEPDCRARALAFVSSRKSGGLVAALNGVGQLAFYDIEDNLKILPAIMELYGSMPDIRKQSVELSLTLLPTRDAYVAVLEAFDATSHTRLSATTLENISPERLIGNVALAANGGIDSSGASFWFRNWQVDGSKMVRVPQPAYAYFYGADDCAGRTTGNDHKK